MTKAERAEFVHRRLAELYPETPIPLDHKDPFTLLVAVLLSAQCTDERVNKVTPDLFNLAEDPAAAGKRSKLRKSYPFSLPRGKRLGEAR